MLIDRVYMPAEIAVNSTVEKIQSSIFLNLPMNKKVPMIKRVTVNKVL